MEDLINRQMLYKALKQELCGDDIPEIREAIEVIQNQPGTTPNLIIRDFLRTVRDTARAWHGDNKVVTSSFCANCPIAGIGINCNSVLNLDDADIEKLVNIYAAEKAKERKSETD